MSAPFKSAVLQKGSSAFQDTHGAASFKRTHSPARGQNEVSLPVPPPLLGRAVSGVSAVQPAATPINVPPPPYITMDNPSDKPAQRVRFPLVPYYGILSGLELRVELRLRFSGVGDHDARIGPDASTDLQRRATRCITETRELVDCIAREEGSAYYFGSRPIKIHPYLSRSTEALPITHGTASTLPRKQGSMSAALSEQPMFDGCAYSQCMSDLEKGLVKLCLASRTVTPFSATCFHVVYLHVAAHPVYKDLLAMAAVEDGKLVVFITTPSRTTQRFISSEALKLGVSMEWVNAAALVCDPEDAALTCAPVPCAAAEFHARSPGRALWCVLSNLDLTRTSGGPAVWSVDASVTSTKERGNTMDSPRVPLEGATHVPVDVTLLSSFPFGGAVECRHVLQPSYHVGVETPPAHGIEATAADPDGSLANTSAQKSPHAVRAILTWRSSGPVQLVLPHFIGSLAVRLRECCAQLESFEIIPQRAAELSSSRRERRGVGGTPGISANVDRRGAGGAGAAFQYLKSSARRHSALQRGGPTLTSWLCFSRLSADAWLSVSDRREYGLVEDDDADGNGATGRRPSADHADDDDESIPLECEFMLNSISYVAPRAAATAGVNNEEEARGAAREKRGRELEPEPSLQFRGASSPHYFLFPCGSVPETATAPAYHVDCTVVNIIEDSDDIGTAENG